MRYKKLTNEILQAGDVYSAHEEKSNGQPYGLCDCSAVYYGMTAERVLCNERLSGSYWRPVTDNWVASEDRLPIEADASNIDKDVLVRDVDGIVRFKPYLEAINYPHWMAIAFNQGPQRVTLYIDGVARKVLPQPDGSVRCGCVEIKSEDMETIIKQRAEAMNASKGGA